MGNATDDLDRFLRTDGIRILMEAGIPIRNCSKMKNNTGEQKGEINHVYAGKDHPHLQEVRQRK